jgi:hypothetical protein
LLYLGGGVRAYAYIDGFNLYYGALKGTAFKWLNPVELVRQVLPPKYTVAKLKYFTARVSGAVDPGEPLRQQTYLAALRSIPEIEIYFGKFLPKNIWRPITNFPAGGAMIHSPNTVSLPVGTHTVDGGTLIQASSLVVGIYPPRGQPRKATTPLHDAFVTEVHAMEEKGSDVNLAVHLLNDAWKGAFDEAVVVSNDTDLVEPIRIVTEERQLPVLVVCPGRRQMAQDLQRVATYKAHINKAILSRSQLPDPIPSIGTMKPIGW